MGHLIGVFCYGFCVVGLVWWGESVYWAFDGWMVELWVKLVGFREVLLRKGSFSGEGMVGFFSVGVGILRRVGDMRGVAPS